MVLKEGVWMAQGPSQNIIIKAVGEAPFIKILKGISMNEFFNTGRVKELGENSIEVQHIVQNPDQYTFDKLTVTSAVNSLLGIGTRTFKKCEVVTDEEIKELTEKYKAYMEMYGTAECDNKFIITVCKEYKIDVGQASNILENKIKKFLNYIQQYAYRSFRYY